MFVKSKKGITPKRLTKSTALQQALPLQASKSFHCQQLRCNELITLAVSAAVVTTDANSSIRPKPVMRGLQTSKYLFLALVGHARDGKRHLLGESRAFLSKRQKTYYHQKGPLWMSYHSLSGTKASLNCRNHRRAPRQPWKRQWECSARQEQWRREIWHLYLTVVVQQGGHKPHSDTNLYTVDSRKSSTTNSKRPWSSLCCS